MTILQFFFFCFFSVVCGGASAVLEVSGHVGGEVSIHCSGSWTADNSSEHYNMYFCKGVCSRENTVIQTERKTSAIKRRGRYSMEVNREEGAFNVTIMRLKRADAGRYHCGVGNNLIVLYQEVILIVLNSSTVPPGSPPSTTMQTDEEILLQGSFAASTAPLPSTAAAAEEKITQQKASKFTDTTLVIIVSGALALLVCAIIPLIFYCRSKQEGQNTTEADKDEADCCEENAGVASTQAAASVQSLEPEAGAEPSAQDTADYVAVYRALDPKSLD